MLKYFSFEYVKKNPLMFGIIFVVFGLLVYLLINRGSSAQSSDGTQYVETGPTPAELQAQVQLAGIQAQANSQNLMAQSQLAAMQFQMQGDLALAAISREVSMAELAASERLGSKQIDASMAALSTQLNADLMARQSDNQFALDYARNASETATQQSQINASTMLELSRMQAAVYSEAQKLAVIPTLKKKDRDNALITLATGQPYRPDPVFAFGGMLPAPTISSSNPMLATNSVPNRV